jgi:hypothetical protein
MEGVMAPTGPSKKEQEKYQAEDDARTMQRMGEIMGDSGRHGRAKKKMDEIMADMEKSRKAMEMMKGAKLGYRNTPKEDK